MQYWNKMQMYLEKDWLKYIRMQNIEKSRRMLKGKSFISPDRWVLESNTEKEGTDKIGLSVKSKMKGNETKVRNWFVKEMKKAASKSMTVTWKNSEEIDI